MMPGYVRLSAERTDDQGDDSYRFIALTEVIRHNLHKLFEGMALHEIQPFRVSRNAAVGSNDEDAEDLLEVVNEELRQRRLADIVRLEVSDTPFRPLNQFLIQEMGLSEADVYRDARRAALQRPLGDPRGVRPARAQVPAVEPGGPSAAGRRRGQHLQRDPRGRCDGPPPLRVV